MKLNKIYYPIFIPVVFFLVSGTFFATPLQDFFLIFHTLLSVLSLIYIFIYFSQEIIKKNRIDNSILLLALLSIFVPLFSALRASMEFGQPIIIGIISERGWFTFGIALWVYKLILQSKVKLKLFENSFLFLSSLPFIFYFLSVIFLDFNDISTDQNFLVIEELRGARFSFQTFFILFSTIYFLIKFNQKNNIISLALFLFFLSYIFFIAQSRILIAFILILIFYFYVSYFSLQKSFYKLFQLFTSFIILFLLVQFINPDYVENLSFLISDTIYSIASQDSADLSYGIRVFTFLTALNYFNISPTSFYFGAGNLSTQFEGGLNEIFGYFYPSDIGIFGGIFTYGIFLLVLLVVSQIYLTLKHINKISNEDPVFVNTIKYVLIFYLFYIPINGFYARATNLVNVDMWAIILLILIAYNKTKEYAKT